MSSNGRKRGVALGVALGMVGASGIAQAWTPALVVQPEPTAPEALAAAAGEPVYYKGAIALPSISLDFTLELRRGLDGAPSGTIDIPMQAFLDQPLVDLEWTDQRLKFAVALPGQEAAAWPNFEFSVVAGQDEVAGHYTGKLRQAGMEFEATLEKLKGEPAGMVRPQVPVPPFPYESREVTFRNEAGDLTIAGTLTVPEGDGQFPCAVMITGSGAQDRDETLFEHRPFLVIADHLSRNGIAVLRCDDRGVGGSGRGNRLDPDSFDFVTDVRAALAFVASQDGIDPSRLGLIGHSEGGLIAPIVAADDANVSFIVLLAGPGVPGDEILVRQGEEMTRALGESEEDLTAQRPLRVRLFAALKESDFETARETMVELMRLAGGEQTSEQLIQRSVDAQVTALSGRWMRTFMDYDPRESLRRVRCPVLALNGDKDLQVLEDQNLPEVERALREGGNTDVTAIRLPGLNHLFQPAATGSMAEYATIETTVDPSALDAMTAWIRRHTGLEGEAAGG